MNIGMILDNEFTGDLRVENEVQALQSNGFNVFVLCLNYGDKPAEEEYHGAKIIRIPKSKKFIKKFRALTNTIINYYPYFWADHIVDFVNEYNIDVLHVHDLYMLGAAFITNKKFTDKLPVVGDLHENYVEGLKHYRFSTTFPGNLLISIPKWEKTEVQWIAQLDYAITVIEEAVERYSLLGLHKYKFTVVSNYINIEEFDNYSVDPKITGKFKNEFVISYIGAFDVHRGLESVVKSLPLVKDKIGKIKLVLVGAGQNQNSLKELATSLGVLDLISFEGWQSPSTLPSYVSASDICIIPHLKTIHTDNTIPHKLFQYMYLERAVLSTDCDPIVRILRESGAGLVYKSDNPADLAEKILELYNDKNKRELMGKNGKDAVLKKFNWNNTAKNLVSLYKQIQKTALK